MTQKTVWYLLIMTLLAGCAFSGQGRPRLCSDYGDRTTIDIVPLLMRSPDYIDRRLSHLDSETTIDAEHLQTTNYRLLDGSRLKISYRDGLAIGFTIYHRIPFHTPMKSLEVLGFTRWELTNEEIRPYSHAWKYVTNEQRELKLYALRDSDFACYRMAQAFVVVPD